MLAEMIFSAIRITMLAIPLLLAFGTAAPARSATGAPTLSLRQDQRPAANLAQSTTVEARIVAVGIPGAGAIGQVGRFLAGGPIHDTAEFASYTQPGAMLDPGRILVGSTSNFGAPRARNDEAAGSLLSIDPNGTLLTIPSGFASHDGQAITADGRVQLFSAQSPAFLNGINTPRAVTAGYAGVSDPRGLSINNAFGRIWPANVPGSLAEASTESILDPTGVPLAGAPDQRSGGVFAGDITDRQPAQLVPGALTTGAVGTAFLGRSPDGGKRAVFAALLADGSVIQMHTEQGVDGLAPAGTISPLTQADSSIRAGAILTFEPLRILYLADPLANSVAALTLLDDRQVFHAGAVQRFSSPEFDLPVGLAPTRPETEDSDWASNTTMFEFSDIYVANRGNNTIVRMQQDGTVIAVEQPILPGGGSLGDARISGIATASDGSRIWITVTGTLPGYEGLDGAVLELPAFGG
jgi:hypothetical protein